MAVEQDHVDDLPDNGDLVQPVGFAADVEQHLLQVHCVVYSDGDCQSQERCYLLIGKRKGEKHEQPDAQVDQPSRLAQIFRGIRRVKRVSKQ